MLSGQGAMKMKNGQFLMLENPKMLEAGLKTTIAKIVGKNIPPVKFIIQQSIIYKKPQGLKLNEE